MSWNDDGPTPDTTAEMVAIYGAALVNQVMPPESIRKGANKLLRALLKERDDLRVAAERAK